MTDEFDQDVYYYRNLIKTMFFVLKRKYDERIVKRNTEIRLKGQIQVINSIWAGIFILKILFYEDYYKATYSFS